MRPVIYLHDNSRFFIGAESTMEVGSGGASTESQNQHRITQTLTTPTTKPNQTRKRGSSSRGGGDEEENQEDEVWKSFSDGFAQVQSVLDRNRTLIQQVNDNHRSRIADNMVKNVALIQEINANISRIVNLYSDLSSDFSTVFHHRAAGGDDDIDCDRNV